MADVKRQLVENRQDLRQVLDGQSLAKALAIAPDLVSSLLSFEMGWDNDAFPLTFLTEGQGNMQEIKDPNGDYVWDVMGAKIMTSQVLVSTTLSGRIGANGAPFKIVFKDNFFIIDHTAYSPSGVLCRVQGQPVPATGGGYEVTLTIVNHQDGAFIPASDITAGKSWGQGIAIVANSLSKGNASHHQLPGRKTNKISWFRKSVNIAGNFANMEAKNISFSTPSGKKCNIFIDFVEWQHTLEWKMYQEEFLMWSEYNKRPDGEVGAIDLETGLPIPTGAGFDQIFREANHDTYGETLTYSRLASNIDAMVYSNTNGIGKAQTAVIFTGSLGFNKIDEALKRETKGSGMYQFLGKDFVRGNYKSLEFGGNFNGFLTGDGHTVIVKKLGILDAGTKAQMQKDNGEIDPIKGKPIMSGDMYIMAADSDGKPNIKMYYEKGRLNVRGVLKGMSPVPTSWKWKGNDETISTDQDIASVHYMASKGINIQDDKYCMKMSYMP